MNLRTVFRAALFAALGLALWAYAAYQHRFDPLIPVEFTSPPPSNDPRTPAIPFPAVRSILIAFWQPYLCWIALGWAAFVCFLWSMGTVSTNGSRRRRHSG